MATLVIRGSRVVLPGAEHAASIHIDEGRIARVAAYDDVPEDTEIVDAGDLVVSPGLVDTHVHVNEPGRADWEGFDTATRAAAAGGVTTIVDMPLNSIPATVDPAALDVKRAAARGRCHVDVAFWGGIVPGNARHLPALADAGVRGFKCFLVPSGVDEFPAVVEADLREAFAALARQPGGAPPVLVHAEHPAGLRAPSGDPRAYHTWLASRPSGAEAAAIEMVAALAAEYDVPAHIVHVSSAEGIAAVERARAAGVRLTAETCPHYLTFAADEVPDGATPFKCAPPIREAPHREALWAALGRGACSMVVTDHSPAPPALKCTETGDFLAAWGGVASLELSLAATWTAARAHGVTLATLASWMSEQPARLARLEMQKGALREGTDADLVIWDPDTTFDVEIDRLQQRHKVTPYAGRRLHGLVWRTYLGGECIWENGAAAAMGRGHLR